MQLDRNISKIDTFHEPTTYVPYVKLSSEQIITFAMHENGRLEFSEIRCVH